MHVEEPFFVCSNSLALVAIHLVDQNYHEEICKWGSIVDSEYFPITVQFVIGLDKITFIGPQSYWFQCDLQISQQDK